MPKPKLHNTRSSDSKKTPSIDDIQKLIDSSLAKLKSKPTPKKETECSTLNSIIAKAIIYNREKRIEPIARPS